MNKSISLISIFCIVSFFSLKAQLSVYDIGIFANLNSSYRSLVSDGSVTSDAIIRSRDDIENPKFSYQFGVNATLLKKERFQIEGNLSLTNYGESIDPQNVVVGYPNDPVFIKLRGISYSYYYLDIIPSFKYYITKSKLRWFVSISPEANLHLFSRRRIKFDGEKDEINNYDADFNTIAFSLGLSIGTEFMISEKIHMDIAPTYRRMISTQLNGTPINSHPYSFGLRAGIHMNLK